MKHIYESDINTKKSYPSAKFIKCINEVNPIPSFQLNFSQVPNSQRSTHQNSERKKVKATIKDYTSPITNKTNINSNKDNHSNDNKSKVNMIMALSHLACGSAEQRIEKENRDLFNQFSFNINQSNPLAKHNSILRCNYIQPFQPKKMIQRSLSQVKIEITDEEMYQHKHYNYKDSDYNYRYYRNTSKKKTNGNHNNCSKGKRIISTELSKPIMSNQSDINKGNNDTNNNNLNEKYYKKVYRDLSLTDLDKKRKMYNKANDILQSFITQSKRDKRNNDKLLIENLNNDGDAKINANDKDNNGNINTQLTNIFNYTCKANNSPRAKSHRNNQLTHLASTRSYNNDTSKEKKTSSLMSSFIQLPLHNTDRSSSCSKNMSTNISCAHFTQEKIDINSYEEIHFVFVEAFQKKKKFLATTTISKQNSIEFDH